MRAKVCAILSTIGLGCIYLRGAVWAATATGSFNVSLKGYELINGVQADIKGVGTITGTAAGALSGGILSYSAVDATLGATPQSDTCTGVISGSIANAGAFGLCQIALAFNDVPPPAAPPSSPLCAAQALTITCTRSDAPGSTLPNFLGGAYVCTVLGDSGAGVSAASLSVELSATSGISPAL